MDELQPYAPEEIILANLREACLRLVEDSEQAYAHLCELAAEIASEFTDASAFLSSLPEHRLPPPSLPEGFGSGMEALAPMLRELAARHSVLLCMELSRRIPTPRSLWLEFFFSGSEEPNRSSFNRISYQRNRYTDEAYERFAALLPEPRASYAHSFRSVCEDVYNGLCEYCILPLENSAEGRLTSFSRLIAEYEMKIAAVCDVQVGEDRVTRFALLRRTVTLLHAQEALPWYYEFSCSLPTTAGVPGVASAGSGSSAPGIGAATLSNSGNAASPNIGSASSSGNTPPAPSGAGRGTGRPADLPGAEDVLCAARFCGLTLCGADISENADGTAVMHPLLRIGRGNLPAFLLYLAMELPGATPIGLYPNLSEHYSNSQSYGK